MLHEHMLRAFFVLQFVLHEVVLRAFFVLQFVLHEGLPRATFVLQFVLREHLLVTNRVHHRPVPRKILFPAATGPGDQGTAKLVDSSVQFLCSFLCSFLFLFTFYKRKPSGKSTRFSTKSAPRNASLISFFPGQIFTSDLAL